LGSDVRAIIESILAAAPDEDSPGLTEVREELFTSAKSSGIPPEKLAGEVVGKEGSVPERRGRGVILFQALENDPKIQTAFVLHHTSGKVKVQLADLLRAGALQRGDLVRLKEIHQEDSPGVERTESAVTVTQLISAESGEQAALDWVEQLEFPEERAEALVDAAFRLMRQSSSMPIEPAIISRVSHLATGLDATSASAIRNYLEQINSK
jgi:hypothetical protein